MTSDTTSTPRTLFYLLGQDLSPAGRLFLLLLLAAQIFCNFQIFHNKPVPNDFFIPTNGYQNIDVPGWIYTGVMLPTNAPAVRAMRPLYPLPLMFAKWLHIVDVNPNLSKFPPGQTPVRPTDDIKKSISILLAYNSVMALAAVWIFCAFCRRFGMTLKSAILATIVAGAGFEFSFLVSQAIPELFGYFAMAVALAAILVGFESNPRGTSRKKEIITWAVIGLVIGILLLGKELYSLPMFAGLLLLFSKRFPALISFSVFVLLPTILWNYYMSKIVGAYDPKAYLEKYRFVIWMFQDLAPQSWAGRFHILWGNLSAQLLAFGRAFAYIPVALAVIGIATSKVIPRQGWILAAFFLSIYMLFLASNFIMPRLLFLTWPIVYFFAWKGVEWVSGTLTRGLKNAENRDMLIRYFRIAAACALVYLGTRQHYSWYFYG